MRQVDVRAGRALAEGRRLKVAVAQASLPVEPDFDERRFAASLEAYTSLSRRAASQGAELVVWPQNAYERRVAMKRLRGGAMRPPASPSRATGQRVGRMAA